MSANLFRTVARHLRDRPAVGGDPSADGELLRRFVRSRDAAAFEAMVRRHGPMVWGVCRRTVRTHADAEDAFQVTFAVLAARAAAVRNPDAVGCWLYGVAARVARRVRAASARLAAGESAAAVPVTAGETRDRLAAQEFLAVLDEELTRLPEKYRGPLVLCYLQEQTQDEAAGQLRVSLSTLKRRLEAGRQLLRGRLERRGVELSAVLAAAGVAGVAPAGLPAATVGAVIGGGVSGPVGAITREVLFAMWTTKVRTWAAGLVVAGGLTGGAGHYAANVYGQGGDPPATPPKTVKTAAVKAPAAPATAPPLPAHPPPPQQAAQEVPADLTEKVRRTELSVKLAEIDLEVAENRVAEAKAKREAAQASGVQVEVLTAEIALRDAMLEVRKAKIKLDAERESLRRLEKRAEAPTRPALPPPPPGTVVVTLPATGGTASVAPAAMPADLRKLREEQLAAARAVLDGMTEAVKAGVGFPEPEDFVTWSKRVRDAHADLNPGDWLQAANDHRARMRDLEQRTDAKVKAGAARPGVGHAVRYHRIEAEIAVKRAEGGAKALPPTGDRGTSLPLPGQPRAALPENFRGTIQQVHDSSGGDVLVNLAPGVDAGLHQGAVLSVHRASPKPVYVGRVVVVMALPKTAIGRFVTPANPLADGDWRPKPGDVLTPSAPTAP